MSPSARPLFDSESSLSGGSWASSLGNRRSMQSNRARDTRPELELRSRLHRLGLRFRKNVRPIAELRCVADIVFPSEKLAVFFDGCWWHSCPLHSSLPKTNREWWRQKFSRNAERDRQNDETLRSAGWSVLRVWEHEPLEQGAARIHSAVKAARAGERPPEALLRLPFATSASDRYARDPTEG